MEQETPYIGNERLMDAMRRVFTLALDGNWKCDRRIRYVCIETLGERVCESLRREWRERKRAEGKLR